MDMTPLPRHQETAKLSGRCVSTVYITRKSQRNFSVMRRMDMRGDLAQKFGKTHAAHVAHVHSHTHTDQDVVDLCGNQLLKLLMFYCYSALPLRIFTFFLIHTHGQLNKQFLYNFQLNILIYSYSPLIVSFCVHQCTIPRD